jgi:hypothetical protein
MTGGKYIGDGQHAIARWDWQTDSAVANTGGCWLIVAGCWLSVVCIRLGVDIGIGVAIAFGIAIVDLEHRFRPRPRPRHSQVHNPRAWSTLGHQHFP